VWPREVRAQASVQETTPFSMWLDLTRRAAAGWPQSGLPFWISSVSGATALATGQPDTTTIQIGLRNLGSLDNRMELRLFFDDVPGAQPTVIGWGPGGVQVFIKGPLGQGLGLATSEMLTFAAASVDDVQITVPGDGHNLRGAFLLVLKSEVIQHGLDFAVTTNLIEAFERSAPLIAPSDDLTLFGRVKATIDSTVTKLSKDDAPTGTWEFDLQAVPLLAVLTFEILDADAEVPPTVNMNDRPLGAVNVALPDLADPAYVGLVRALEPGMRFRYSGWLRVQKVIPTTALLVGTNRLVLELPSNAAGAVAVRSLSLQLKYNWTNLDYSLAPTAP
jgi:hypothetical protein